MGARLPTTLLRRPRAASNFSTQTAPHHHLPPSNSSCSRPQQQVRHATFVPRHRRPYQFTQLVQLSDGSTFTLRTTSPVPLYRSTKDTRNHVLWQPSEATLRDVEVDEAGKLAAFRSRYGHGWDSLGDDPKDAAAAVGTEAKGDPMAAGATAAEGESEAQLADDASMSLADLISGYAAKDEGQSGSGLSAKEQAKMDRGKKKK